MIPARIGHSKKKLYDLTDGQYFGVWQDYFCWLYRSNLRGEKSENEIFYRFETSAKSKKRENVRVIFKVPHAYIYEILKKKNT